MMESLKKVQQLCRVPTSAMLARERKLGHFTATVTTPGVATHADGGQYSVPPDTFIVPRHDMIKTIGQQNAKAQHRLCSSEQTTSELGRGLALVTWEAHNSYGRGLSWLGAAAAASGLSFSKTLNEEDAAVSFFRPTRTPSLSQLDFSAACVSNAQLVSCWILACLASL